MTQGQDSLFNLNLKKWGLPTVHQNRKGYKSGSGHVLNLNINEMGTTYVPIRTVHQSRNGCEIGSDRYTSQHGRVNSLYRHRSWNIKMPMFGYGASLESPLQDLTYTPCPRLFCPVGQCMIVRTYVPTMHFLAITSLSTVLAVTTITEHTEPLSVCYCGTPYVLYIGHPECRTPL